MKRFLLAVVVLSLVLACGKRWYPAEPRVLQLGSPQLAYDATLAALENQGYWVARQDPARGQVVTKSKVDQPDDRYREAGDDKRVSWISFQAYQDGSLRVTTWGYHVKQDEGVMHRKLASEVDELLQRIHSTAQALYRAQFGPQPQPQPHPPPQY